MIIYVTYYNHPFSKADRQFLEQLGRVKDQFALDKMFFTVNAADLAQSQDELQAVCQHVEHELLKCGVRHPRIHPVSSLKALKGEEDSGLDQFYEQFRSFLQQDVSSLMLADIEKEMAQGEHYLQQMITEASSSEAERAEKVNQLQQFKKQGVEEVENSAYSAYIQEMRQELEEHRYHIKQRIMHRFQEHFNEAFHPSVLTGSAKKNKVIQTCLKDFLYAVYDQIVEEWKATSLRMERFLAKLSQRMIDEWLQTWNDQGVEVIAGSYPSSSLGIPNIPTIELEEFSQSFRVMKYFKSSKQFFEQGGKDQLRSDLEQEIISFIEPQMKRTTTSFEEFYLREWHSIENQSKEWLSQQLTNDVNSRITALEDDTTLRKGKEALEAYRNTIQKK